MGIKVLLMTDDEPCITPLKTALKVRLPLERLLVSPGPLSALYLGSHHDPEALIIDQRFGRAVVSGTIEELRRELTPTRFILLTPDDGEAAAERARSWGAADHLPRTMQGADLARCFQGLVRPEEMADDDAGLVPAICLAPPPTANAGPVGPPL